MPQTTTQLRGNWYRPLNSRAQSILTTLTMAKEFLNVVELEKRTIYNAVQIRAALVTLYATHQLIDRHYDRGTGRSTWGIDDR